MYTAVMFSILRRLGKYISLILVFTVTACAVNHADAPVNAPGNHQDLWEDVAGGPFPLTRRASDLLT